MTHHRFWTLWQDFLEKAAQGLARLPTSLGKTQSNDDPTALPILTARRAASPVTIDGRLDEAGWERVALSTGFWMSNKKKALAETGVKALHDDQNLYLAIACAERDTKSLKADAKDELGVFHSKDDAVAIFIQPDEAKPLYYQMAFNTKGISFDQRVAGGDRDYDYHPQWRNATQAEAGYWTSEVAFPYKAFGLTGRQKEWRMNVCRRVRNDMLKRSSWSCVAGDWHSPGRFGYVRFE